MGKSKRNRNKQPEAAQAQTKAKAPAKSSGAGKTDSGARKVPIIPVTIGVVAVVIAIALFAGRGANTVSFVDGKTSRTIATVDECAFTTVQLELPTGTDPEEAATAIFDALSRAAGVGLVTVYEDDPRVDIDYCQSYTSEPALREALEPTGYLAPFEPTPVEPAPQSPTPQSPTPQSPSNP